MKVLFIGNSYTYYNDMPALFAQLARSNQKDVAVYSVTKGGRKLLDFMEADDATLSLDALLAEHTFDICFIQEQSILPAAKYEDFVSGLDHVVNKLRGKVHQIYLYATWGRKQGSATLTEYHWTTESMTGLLWEAYQNAAKAYGAAASPVGNNFLYVTQNHPEVNLYDEDRSHPSYQGSCLAALTHYHTAFGHFPQRAEVLALSYEELSVFQSAIFR